jgi:hypothetical protein
MPLGYKMSQYKIKNITVRLEMPIVLAYVKHYNYKYETQRNKTIRRSSDNAAGANNYRNPEQSSSTTTGNTFLVTWIKLTMKYYPTPFVLHERF